MTRDYLKKSYELDEVVHGVLNAAANIYKKIVSLE